MATIIKILQGTDGGIRWTVNDGDTQQPIDFTSWTIDAQVRSSVSDAVVLHEWSTALGNAAGDALGHVVLHWTHVETSGFTFTSGVFDIELTSPSGKVSRLDSGRVVVSSEVTR